MSVEYIVQKRVQRLKENIKKNNLEDIKNSSKGLFSFVSRKSTYETDEAFINGFSSGFEEGLRDSFNTDKLVNTMDLKEERHKEFYDKFLELANKYNCRFSFHPLHGMMLEDLHNET